MHMKYYNYEYGALSKPPCHDKNTTLDNKTKNEIQEYEFRNCAYERSRHIKEVKNTNNLLISDRKGYNLCIEEREKKIHSINRKDRVTMRQDKDREYFENILNKAEPLWNQDYFATKQYENIIYHDIHNKITNALYKHNTVEVNSRYNGFKRHFVKEKRNICKTKISVNKTFLSVIFKYFMVALFISISTCILIYILFPRIIGVSITYILNMSFAIYDEPFLCNIARLAVYFYYQMINQILECSILFPIIYKIDKMLEYSLWTKSQIIDIFSPYFFLESKHYPLRKLINRLKEYIFLILIKFHIAKKIMSASKRKNIKRNLFDSVSTNIYSDKCNDISNSPVVTSNHDLKNRNFPLFTHLNNRIYQFLIKIKLFKNINSNNKYFSNLIVTNINKKCNDKMNGSKKDVYNGRNDIHSKYETKEDVYSIENDLLFVKKRKIRKNYNIIYNGVYIEDNSSYKRLNKSKPLLRTRNSALIKEKNQSNMTTEIQKNKDYGLNSKQVQFNGKAKSTLGLRSIMHDEIMVTNDVLFSSFGVYSDFDVIRPLKNKYSEGGGKIAIYKLFPCNNGTSYDLECVKDNKFYNDGHRLSSILGKNPYKENRNMIEKNKHIYKNNNGYDLKYGNECNKNNCTEKSNNFNANIPPLNIINSGKIKYIDTFYDEKRISMLKNKDIPKLFNIERIMEERISIHKNTGLIHSLIYLRNIAKYLVFQLISIKNIGAYMNKAILKVKSLSERMMLIFKIELLYTMTANLRFFIYRLIFAYRKKSYYIKEIWKCKNIIFLIYIFHLFLIINCKDACLPGSSMCKENSMHICDIHSNWVVIDCPDESVCGMKDGILGCIEPDEEVDDEIIDEEVEETDITDDENNEEDVQKKTRNDKNGKEKSKSKGKNKDKKNNDVKDNKNSHKNNKLNDNYDADDADDFKSNNKKKGRKNIDKMNTNGDSKNVKNDKNSSDDDSKNNSDNNNTNNDSPHNTSRNNDNVENKLKDSNKEKKTVTITKTVHPPSETNSSTNIETKTGKSDHTTTVFKTITKRMPPTEVKFELTQDDHGGIVLSPEIPPSIKIPGHMPIRPGTDYDNDLLEMIKKEKKNKSSSGNTKNESNNNINGGGINNYTSGGGGYNNNASGTSGSSNNINGTGGSNNNNINGAGGLTNNGTAVGNDTNNKNNPGNSPSNTGNKQSNSGGSQSLNSTGNNNSQNTSGNATTSKPQGGNTSNSSGGNSSKPSGGNTSKTAGAGAPKPSSGGNTSKPAGSVAPKPSGGNTSKPTGSEAPKQAGGDSPKPTGDSGGDKKDSSGGDKKPQGSGGGGGKVDVTNEQIAQAVTTSGFSAPDDTKITAIVNAINEKMESKEEAAMFIAQCIHETGGFEHSEEIKCKESADACKGEYTSPLGIEGKSYHGRGYIQLSWPENYKNASEGLGMGDELLQNPEKVAEDPELSINTAIWFWETNVRSAGGVSENHFGATTKAINGPLECGGGSDVPAKRYEIYKHVAEAFGVENIADESGCG